MQRANATDTPSEQPTDLDPLPEPQSEIEEYLEVSQQRRRVLPRAALVGLGAGLVAALFRLALEWANTARDALLNWAHLYPALGWIYPLFFSVSGATLSV